MFSLVPGVFLFILKLDSFVLLPQKFLLFFSREFVFVCVIKVVLELGRLFPEGLNLITDILELSPRFVEPNGKFRKNFL